jgi:phospholipid-binding lipoprotein MlaA
LARLLPFPALSKLLFIIGAAPASFPMPRRPARRRAWQPYFAPLLMLALLSAGGCSGKSGSLVAESPSSGDAAPSAEPAVENDDPYRPANVRVYKFNDTVDHLILKPMAQGYQFVTPRLVSRGVTNFFSNLGEPRVIMNDLFQGKLRQAIGDATRFGVNSLAGVGGLFDIATPFGLPKHDEDFGQTLAIWGWKDSAYVMLPGLGSSSTRDVVGIAVDFFTYPLLYYHDIGTRNALYVLQLVDHRANLLDAEAVLNQAASEDERYDFVREAYTQQRENEIYDGNAPLDLPYKLDNDTPDTGGKPKQ